MQSQIYKAGKHNRQFDCKDSKFSFKSKMGSTNFQNLKNRKLSEGGFWGLNSGFVKRW